MQGERVCVFVVRLGGGIDLPSSWLTFFFRQSSSVSFLSLPHTHTLIPKASLLFFCSSLFLSHTVPDQSQPPHLSACFNPLPNTHTQGSVVLTATAVR